MKKFLTVLDNICRTSSK